MGETTELLRRWQEGDDEALGHLVREWLPIVHKHASELLGAKLRNKVSSEDIAQDAMMDFLRNRPSYAPVNRGQLVKLLTVIVTHAIADKGHYFKAARRAMDRERNLGSSLGLVDADTANDPAHAAQQNELRQRVRMALELLDARLRWLLLERMMYRRPVADIAAEMAMSEDAVEALLRRAKEKLRDLLVRLRRDGLESLLDEML